VKTGENRLADDETKRSEACAQDASRRSLGPEHPNTNLVRCNLSQLVMGDSTEALVLSGTALAAQVKVLGRNHLWTKHSARVTADALDAPWPH
jgi:hypothetical protein